VSENWGGSVKDWLSGLKQRVGLDFHIFLTLASRLWTVVAGAVMIIGLPHWLSGEEQGFYFTFYSLIGLQVFFEMGLNYVVVQFVGHEVAHLQFNDQGSLSGPAKNLQRLGSLVRLLHRWYLGMAIAFGILVAIAGAWFFARSHELPVSAWLGPWLMLVGLAAVNLYVSPFLSVVEGAGFVGQVARLRLLMSILGYLPLWALMSAGAGLWAVPCAQLSLALGCFLWLRLRARFVLDLRSAESGGEGIRWRDEIFPFQWRIALSWISGYFIFQLFNPILFARRGALEAGRAGLALTIFMTLLTVSMSWVNAKAPVIAGLLARQEKLEAQSLFRGLLLRSALFNLLGCAGVLAGVWGLHWFGLGLAERLPDYTALFCIAVATISNHLVSALAVFMRAHKEEPLVYSSMGMAVLSISGVFLAAGYGTDIVMATYAILALCVGLPWALFIFRRYWAV